MNEWTPPPDPEDLPKTYEAWGSGHMNRLNDYLVDRFFADGQPTFKIEQPIEGCPCLNYGLLTKEWVYGRPSKCDCPRATDDYDNVLHEIDCDSVVCPFCALENRREE